MQSPGKRDCDTVIIYSYVTSLLITEEAVVLNTKRHNTQTLLYFSQNTDT